VAHWRSRRLFRRIEWSIDAMEKFENDGTRSVILKRVSKVSPAESIRVEVRLLFRELLSAQGELYFSREKEELMLVRRVSRSV